MLESGPYRCIAWLVVALALNIPSARCLAADQAELVVNGGFEQPGATPSQAAGFVFTGDVVRGFAGRPGREYSSMGAIFTSFRGTAAARAGTLHQEVRGLTAGRGEWLRFRFRGLPEEHFSVSGAEDLFMRLDFFGDGGRTALDGVVKPLWDDVVRHRRDLDSNGVGKREGAAVWQDYIFDLMLPFPHIDTLRLTIGFRNGNASEEGLSRFLIDDVSLTRIHDPTGLAKAAGDAPSSTAAIALQDGSTLVHLGGRWYFERLAGSSEVPREFGADVANRLYYLSDRFEAPFAGNMTAWMHPGYLTRSGQAVTEDRLVTDNVVATFADGCLVVRAKDLPNHPTGLFPGYLHNPNAIQEQASTWYIPLEPRRNEAAVAMTAHDANHALPMGPIGIAVNGVEFFNPFDAGMEEAVDIMDRCCGHPDPRNAYHYHKYPVCVHSPFADDGTAHSPLIGWAFDGFPIYGPYEQAGVMAKDAHDNPLNAFNLHFDAKRGWHYHVTPGRLPYLIGGYWGVVDARNLARGRGGPGPGGRPGGGPGGGPGGPGGGPGGPDGPGLGRPPPPFGPPPP